MRLKQHSVCKDRHALRSVQKVLSEDQQPVLQPAPPAPLKIVTCPLFGAVFGDSLRENVARLWRV